MKLITIIFLAMLIQASPAAAQEPPRQQAIHKHGPIDESTAALIRDVAQADGWRRPSSPALSNFHNMEYPLAIYGDNWEIAEINFDFTTGYEWINQPRSCRFIIYAYSPEASTEAFPVHSATYYTPVFETGGEYWTYQYDGYWEGRYFVIILEGPPIDTAEGEEGFIQWWIDISHTWLFPPFVKSHWTSWRNPAYCEGEVAGDPYYEWNTLVVKVSDGGWPQDHYLHMPYVE